MKTYEGLFNIITLKRLNCWYDDQNEAVRFLIFLFLVLLPTGFYSWLIVIAPIAFITYYSTIVYWAITRLLNYRSK